MGGNVKNAEICQLSPVSFDKLEKQDKDRVRIATEEARAKARDRNAIFYQILPTISYCQIQNEIQKSIPKFKIIPKSPY